MGDSCTNKVTGIDIYRLRALKNHADKNKMANSDR